MNMEWHVWHSIDWGVLKVQFHVFWILDFQNLPDLRFSKFNEFYKFEFFTKRSKK